MSAAENESGLRQGVRRVLLLPIYLFAVLTILTHASRYLRLPFSLYAAAAGVVALLAVVLWILLVLRDSTVHGTRDRLSLALLLCVGALGAAFASIYRLPDTDDYSYVPDAVHYLTDPSDAMGYSVHYAYTGGMPHFSIVESTSQPFEYSLALLAYFTGADFLLLYHILIPAMAGFCLPLAVFLLLSHFSGTTLDSVLATGLVVGVLTILGESKIAMGSLSFTRLFQGKIVLLSVALPAFCGMSLDFLKGPSFRHWLSLVLMATAMAGLSSTAFFLAPMLALVLGIAAFLTLGPRRIRFRLIVGYGLSLSYVVGYGLYAARSVSHHIGAGAEAGLAQGRLYAETVQRWLVPDRPVSAVVFALSLAVVVLLVRGYPRRILLLWTLAACLLYLNPVAAPFWASNVTGVAVYWRTVFTLPLVPMVGTAFMACLERGNAWSLRVKLGATLLALLAFGGLNLVPGSTSIFRRGGTVGLPGLRVWDSAYRVAQAVVAKVPPGVMLAPEAIAGTTPMVSGGYPQLRLPDGELWAWVPGSAQLVLRSSDFAEGDLGYRQDFLSLVQAKPALSIVVLVHPAYALVSEALAGSGFSHALRIDEYTIAWRAVSPETEG